MKKVLLIGCVGLPLLVILVGVIAYAAMDSNYEVTSTISIDAEPARIYPLVNTLNRWPEWTVWTTEKYPGLVTEYSGPESGVGAKSSWNDTETSGGSGSMEITRSDPATGIDYTMQFEGFPESQGWVHFAQKGTATEVTFGMRGEMPGVGKLFIPVMKPMMQEEFDQNLANLKEVVEGTK